jgi:TRAP-type mannitol/chloroaromatic compound transport system permease small subunit
METKVEKKTFVEQVSGWAIRAGGAMMLIAALVIAYDVIVRKLFNVTVGGADELAGYAFAIATSWSFAFVLLHRGNVRIDAVYMHLPKKVCLFLDIVALIALGSFVAVLARYGYDVMSTSITMEARSNSTLRIPLWIPQLMWWAGLVLFLVVLAFQLFRACYLLLTGRAAEAQALIGAVSTAEEAKNEFESALQAANAGHVLNQPLPEGAR